MSGRPLRFLATTLGGWTLMRVIVLWPTIDTVPALIHAVVPSVAAAERVLPAARAPIATLALARPAAIARPAPMAAPAPALARPRTPSDPRRVALALAGLVRFGAAVETDDGGEPGLATPTPVVRTAAALFASGRLAGSSWLIARPGMGGGAAVAGGQLGGAQGGMRLTYALGDARRVAIAGRVSSPLRGAGREASLGVEWQPTALPVRLVVERRVALDGARGGTAAGVIGGVGPVEIAPGVRLESYGQAGAIARAGAVEGFADGSVRAAHAIGDVAGIRLDIGVGAWGGAQRGARRLDLGPSIGVALPAAGRSLRLTLDWRQRVAGAARPGSGPALSIGSDF